MSTHAGLPVLRPISRARRAAPHDVKLVRPVKQGQSLCWADVAMGATTAACRTRKAMEAMFAPPSVKVA